MSCKTEWDRRFLSDNFEKVFLQKKYKEHRENTLFNRELSMLSVTQPFVEREIEIEMVTNEIKELKEFYFSTLFVLENKLKELKNNNIDKRERKKFIRKCPNNECLGFLSSSLKCGLCNMYACNNCREIKGSGHVCNEDILASVQFLEKDTKECPKCTTLIFKISGCFEKDTPILMWDQSVKMSQDIKIGDILIGDDGEPRNVLNVCSGEDNMYEITQNNGENYIVNSKHTLVLKIVGDDEEVEMLVDDYMKLTETKKKTLVGFKSSNGINYLEQQVHLDPYMLGLWLGDGIELFKNFLIFLYISLYLQYF